MMIEPGAAGAVWTMTLLVTAFTIKHFIADFLLQTSWMACGKEKPGGGWFLPLASHVLCHAVLALAIVVAVAPRLWWLALVDFAIHITVDRSKTLVAQWGGWSQAKCQYWWVFGVDQLLHQLTNIGLSAALLLLR